MDLEREVYGVILGSEPPGLSLTGAQGRRVSFLLVAGRLGNVELNDRIIAGLRACLAGEITTVTLRRYLLNQYELGDPIDSGVGWAVSHEKNDS